MTDINYRTYAILLALIFVLMSVCLIIFGSHLFMRIIFIAILFICLIFMSFNFYRNKLKIDERKKKIGDLPDLDKNPDLKKFVEESYNLVTRGSFRAGFIQFMQIIEHLLRQKYKDDKLRLVELINKAKEDELITRKDKHFLEGLREERNDLIHRYKPEVTEREIINLTCLSINMIKKIYDRMP